VTDRWNVVRARKSVKQSYKPSPEVLSLMQSFRQMVNDCIQVGLSNDASSLKRLSVLSYPQLKRYEGYSPYRLTAISKAAGIISARRKSIKRGFPTKTPYLSKNILVSCYGFKIKDGSLVIHLDADSFETIPLNAHTLNVLPDPSLTVRSFTLTERSLSLCISKEVKETEVGKLTSTVGIDRNLRNLTAGHQEKVTYYDMGKVVEVAENTRSIVRSFKRNDARIRKQLSMKYGRRRSERVKQLIHHVTKDIVQNARTKKQAIVFEEIGGIRKLYRRGNGQGTNYRSKMNSWPFYEVKRQIE
jgi:putative transposase